MIPVFQELPGGQIPRQIAALQPPPLPQSLQIPQRYLVLVFQQQREQLVVPSVLRFGEWGAEGDAAE